MMSNFEIRQGDALQRLREMPDESVHCCVTSPPYFGLRDYGTGTWEGGDVDCKHKHGGQVPQSKNLPAAESVSTGLRPGTDNSICRTCGAVRVDRQIGLEKTPDEFVAKLVEVFREVRRVLRSDGTAWINMGDSFCSTDKWGGGKSGNAGKHTVADSGDVPSWAVRAKKASLPGIKPKDLMGIPWSLAFALRDDGWYLRQHMPWVKKNGMPESTKDRPTSSVESIFLLTKSPRYFYDYEAVKKPVAASTPSRYTRSRSDDHKYADGGPRSQTIHMKQDGHGRRHAGFNEREFSGDPRETRARRNSDWFAESLDGMLTDDDGNPLAFYGSTLPNKDAHYACFPITLAEPCVLAGCPVDGLVIDPFCGTGTTGLAALKHGRRFIGIELNPDSVEIANSRVQRHYPLLAVPA